MVQRRNLTLQSSQEPVFCSASANREPHPKPLSRATLSGWEKESMRESGRLILKGVNAVEDAIP